MTRKSNNFAQKTLFGFRMIRSVSVVQGNFSELAYIIFRIEDSEAQWSPKVELKIFSGHSDMALEAWAKKFKICQYLSLGRGGPKFRVTQSNSDQRIFKTLWEMPGRFSNLANEFNSVSFSEPV